MVSIYLHLSLWLTSPILKVGAWSNGYARGGRFFWISDVHAMLQKLAEYQHNIHFRHPGAQQALKDFKDQQKNVVASIRNVSSISFYYTIWNYT